MHRYLGRRVGDLADDLLSETFLIAFRRRATYRADRVEVRPWVRLVGGGDLARFAAALVRVTRCRWAGIR